MTRVLEYYQIFYNLKEQCASFIMNSNQNFMSLTEATNPKKKDI